MSGLFNFPLKIEGDRGTIRIVDAKGNVVIPEFLWNNLQDHYERQSKVAEAVLKSLEIAHSPIFIEAKGVAGDNHCVESNGMIGGIMGGTMSSGNNPLNMKKRRGCPPGGWPSQRARRNRGG